MKLFRLVLLIWASGLICCHASLWGQSAGSSEDISVQDGDSEVAPPPVDTEADGDVDDVNLDNADDADIIGDVVDETDGDVISSPAQETAHSSDSAASTGVEEDEECDAVNEDEPDPAAEDVESIVERYSKEALAGIDLGNYSIDDYLSRDLDDFNMSNLTFGGLNASLYEDLNLTLSSITLNFSMNDTLINGSFAPWNLSLSSLLENYSSILKLKESSFHRLHRNGSHRHKANKTSLWQCYNGSGLTYGAVRLLDNFNQLTVFLHRLACCDRTACPTVAEQQHVQWWHNGSAGCPTSRRLNFRRLVMAGSQCVAPGGVWLAANASSAAASRTPIPINLNVLWAGDPVTRGTSMLERAAAELESSIVKLKRNASGGGSNATGNGSEAAEATTTQRCQCAVLMIFSPTCPYSVKLSPVYSALARRFPALPFLAIDADSNSSIHYVYGVVGLPTVILLHKHKDRYFARSFADWQDLELMSTFVTKFTGLKPLPNITVKASDYDTGLPVIVRTETDYLLIFSTLYVVLGAWFLVVR